MLSIDACPAHDAPGKGGARGQVCESGVVELVRRNCGVLTRIVHPWPAALASLLKNDEPATLRPLVHDRVSRHHADHLPRLAMPGNRARQVYEPAALRVDRQTGAGGGADLPPHRRIGLERGHVRLREAAADEQGIGARQTSIAERAEEVELGAGILQGLQVVRVVEAEGRIAGDGDRDIALMRLLARLLRNGDEFICAARDLEHAAEVDVVAQRRR